tara:strand:- start:4501 stop:5079 length:579 start_codon:yes stop_codon:yes gene_type:complete
VSLAIGNIQINKDGLIFEDQLSSASGFINTQSIDPMQDLIGNSNYIDFGASFLIHNQIYILGLSLKHLNQPNTSFNQENQFKKTISISVQGGVEFDINPFDRNFLPRYSYLLTYAALTRSEKSYYIDLVQDIRLGSLSLGLTQKLSNVGSFNFNSVGISFGLQYENFEFGLAYNFPLRAQAKTHSPSIFEIF